MGPGGHRAWRVLPAGRGPGLGRASSEPVSPRTDGPTDTASLAAEGGRREAGPAGPCGLRTGSCSAVLSSPWSAERGWGRRAWGPGRTRPGPEPVALARAVGQGRVPRTQLAGTHPQPHFLLTLRGRSGRGCSPRTGRGAGGLGPGSGTPAAEGPCPHGGPFTLARLLSPGLVTPGETRARWADWPHTPPSSLGGLSHLWSVPWPSEAQRCWGAEWVHARHMAGATPQGPQRPQPSLVWSGTRGGTEGADARPRSQICAGFRSGSGRTGKGCGPGWVHIPGAEPGGGRQGQEVVWAQACCSQEPPAPSAAPGPQGVSAGSEPVSPWARGQILSAL